MRNISIIILKKNRVAVNTHLKRNSYLSRHKSKNSSKNAIQRNSHRRSSIICINKVRRNTRITPTIPIFFNKTPSTKKERKNLQRKKPTQKKKNTDNRDMYMLHTYPPKNTSAWRKTRKPKEGTPQSHL